MDALKGLDGIPLTPSELAAEQSKQELANARIRAQIATKVQARVDEAIVPKVAQEIQTEFEKRREQAAKLNLSGITAPTLELKQVGQMEQVKSEVKPKKSFWRKLFNF